jgi:hypothetical protein
MANNLQLSYAAVNAEANALAPLMNSGKLRIYDGTPPTHCDDALSGNNLLAELTMNATAFGAAANGVLTANAITGNNAALSGTASFYRIFNSAASTAYIQGTVGTATADLILNSVAISAGAAVSIASLTHTVPRGV